MNLKSSKLLVLRVMLKTFSFNSVGFPRLYWYGREGDFNFMAIELLGKNLDEVMKVCGHRFSLETVINIQD